MVSFRKFILYLLIIFFILQLLSTVTVESKKKHKKGMGKHNNHEKGKHKNNKRKTTSKSNQMTTVGLGMGDLTTIELALPNPTAPGLTAPPLMTPNLTAPGLTAPPMMTPNLTASGLTTEIKFRGMEFQSMMDDCVYKSEDTFDVDECSLIQMTTAPCQPVACRMQKANPNIVVNICIFAQLYSPQDPSCSSNSSPLIPSTDETVCEKIPNTDKMDPCYRLCDSYEGTTQDWGSKSTYTAKSDPYYCNITSETTGQQPKRICACSVLAKEIIYIN